MNLTNIQDIYNQSYQKFTPEWFDKNNLDAIDQYLLSNNKTLIDFFEDYIESFGLAEKLSNLDALDLGCGLGGLSFYLANKVQSVRGIDISNLAISCAKQISSLKGLKLDFESIDLTKEINLDQKYDLIVDSHLLHCLTADRDREKYFKFIKNHLSDSGLFICESMVFQSRMEIPFGYSFDENNTLYCEISNKDVPIRKILSAIDLENEIKNSGLKIKYFYYHNELSFEVFTDYKDYPFEYLPKTVRFVLEC